MINFNIMILIQCIIVGVSLYAYLRFGWDAIKAKTWGDRICSFCVMQVFFFSILLIAAYWYDSIETNNTLFSEPIHKVIEIPKK